jgi:hypothetical protein
MGWVFYSVCQTMPSEMMKNHMVKDASSRIARNQEKLKIKVVPSSQTTNSYEIDEISDFKDPQAYLMSSISGVSDIADRPKGFGFVVLGTALAM